VVLVSGKERSCLMMKAKLVFSLSRCGEWKPCRFRNKQLGGIVCEHFSLRWTKGLESGILDGPGVMKVSSWTVHG
jgi:hypothetical protein